ncbi:polyprenyl diphosphate synthase [Elioraea sp.]|jgi:undecaprenyl diphosphate synthase|uniref:polyprenyl diphosphate synthase n=1 Tax=Elioraea sp. TaxID=2185103 RepID=UPI0021DC6DE3|nr:polyprenyl diphosphate synthase [Elioraea sp.]GIX11690.1 MAG: isoprenyl transferase 2 [Elioraea sp.]
MNAPLPIAAAGVPLPTARHVAIIMDGNRRWAARRGLPALAGHREGAEAARRAVDAALAQGVPWLTLYAFSLENWRRPAEEVGGLMGLLRQGIERHWTEMIRRGVRLRMIGERDRLDRGLREAVERAEASSRANTRLNLVIALSYGGRAEIAGAARRIARAAAEGRIDPDTIDETTFARHLETEDMPDPDLVIRTSGEQRLSNFLLWQAAYAEFVFLDVLWPDFAQQHFVQALSAFALRERRYGARPG